MDATRWATLATAVLVLGGCSSTAPIQPSAPPSTTTNTTLLATTTTSTVLATTTTSTTLVTTTKATAPATAAPTTVPKAPASTAAPTTAASSVYYPNCAAVKAAGKAPLHRGDPGYSSKLDRDGDGVACES